MSRVYDDPEAEHARLDRLLRARLRFLRVTERWLNTQVIRRWQTSALWDELSIPYKERLLAEVEAWVGEETENKGAAA